VGTDNSPVDYKYISNRLATEIVQQDAAERSRQELSWNLRLSLFGLAIKYRQPDYFNRFDLARRATEAVRDNTGTIEFPGPYVHGELDLHTCAFAVHMGWDGPSNNKVAALVADQEVGGKRTFVALFGSVSNYIGHEPTAPGAGFFPSDADGLYEILEASLESSDSRIDRHFLGEERRLDDMGKIEAALRIAGGAMKAYPSMRLQFLAKVHYHLCGAELIQEHYDYVLIGAGVWAATPPPKPLRIK
jgi:hypothetical protein